MRGHQGAVRRCPAGFSASALVLVAGLTASCTADSTDEPSASGSPSPTVLSEVDLAGVELSRTEFCDDLDDAAVAEVLGGEPDASDSYASGQRAEVAPGLNDVAHEHSCYFERGAEAELRTARAWLFAQSVTADQARAWIAVRERTEGCGPAGELAFGDPGLIQSCDTGSRRRITAVGLFGDSWLTCQATGPATGPESLAPEELLEQTQRWCVQVAETAAL